MLSTDRARLGAMLLGLFLALSPWRGPSGSDGVAMLATAESLLYRHTLAVDDRFATDVGVTPSARRGPDGRAYSKYGIGLPLVEVPLLATADLAAAVLPVDAAVMRRVLFSLLNPLFATLTCLFVAVLAGALGASSTHANRLACATGVSTLLLHHATGDGADVLGTCAVTGALAALAGFQRTYRRGLAWACGGALATAVLSRVVLVATAPAVAAAFVLANWSQAGRLRYPTRRAVAWSLLTDTLPVTVPVALAFGVTLWLNDRQFGSPWQTGYNDPVMLGDARVALFGLTVSVNKGLAWFAPPAALGLVVGWRLARQGPALPLAILGSAVALLFATVHFYDWGGGWTWGPRYLLPIVPALVAASAGALESRVGRVALGAACLLGVLVSSLGALVNHDAYRRTLAHVWMPEVTGVARSGDTLRPGVIVETPVPAEDVVPQFSEIVGHAWMLRVAAVPCNCSEPTLNCGCRTGAFEEAATFLAAPWRSRYPDIDPTVPYGAPLFRPALAEFLYRRFVFDVDAGHPAGP